jgi:hypothetical protein
MPHVFRNLALILPFLLHMQVLSPFPETAVQQNEASLDFPNAITFSIRAENPQGIAKVTLIYGTDAQLCLAGDTRHDIPVQGDPQIDTSWTWDLNRSGTLPPGVEIHWQWEIVDSSGGTRLTDRKTLVISDPDYTWHTVTVGDMRVDTTEGASSFGQLVTDTAASSLRKISRQIGVAAPSGIHIVVYPSAQDLVNATVGMPDWIGGVAFPEYNVVLMGIAPDETAWAAHVIPHELTHLIVHRRILNCQGATLPTWLDEGLAVASEGPAPADSSELVTDALTKENAPALVQLKAGFPGSAAVVSEEYAQSGLVAQWLLATYGAEKMDALLAAIHSGVLIDDAFKQVYGTDTGGLDAGWRTSLGFTAEPSAPHEQATQVEAVIPTLALESPLGGRVTPTHVAIATTLSTAEPLPATVVPMASQPAPNSSGIPIYFLVGGGIAILLVGAGAILNIRSNQR